MYIYTARLVERGFVEPYPLLTVPKPDKGTLQRAKSLGPSLKGTSCRALLWALSEASELPDVTEEEACKQLSWLDKDTWHKAKPFDGLRAYLWVRELKTSITPVTGKQQALS